MYVAYKADPIYSAIFKCRCIAAKVRQNNWPVWESKWFKYFDPMESKIDYILKLRQQLDAANQAT